MSMDQARHRGARGASHGARCKSKRRGAAMVETWFIILVLLTMTMGLIQYGLIYNAMLTLNNLSREGSRYAAVRAGDMTTKMGSEAAGRAELKRLVAAYLKARARGTSIDLGDTDANLVIQAPKIESNAPVRVVIKYNLIKSKSFVPGLIPLPASYASYEASAVNLIE